jgi:hypothetical protein
MKKKIIFQTVCQTFISDRNDFKGKDNPNHIVAFINKVVLTDIVNDSL